MITNSALRISEILEKLISDTNRSIADAWKQVFDVQSIVEMYIGIGKVDEQLTLLENKFLEKQRNTERIAPVIQEIRLFLNYPNVDAQVSSFVSSHLKQANILAIGMAETIFELTDGENIIEQEKLDQISTMLDDLMKDMEVLEIDKKTKKLFLKVLHEMKISLKFYEIDGVSAIEESLINLICKIKVIEENAITGSFVSKAKQFLGYAVETIATAVIEKGTESLYDSVIKGAIGK